MENCLVSVIVKTYNQESFIAHTIESILQQKTNFEFEVLIFDGGSTDKTKEIVGLYEKKYPEKIKTNLNSKEISPVGRYIALCNGGDVWTDEMKIQTQLEVIEHHPSIDVCVHAVSVISVELGQAIGRIMPSKHNSVFSVEQIIDGGEKFISDGSIFYRARIDEDMPAFRVANDTPYAILLHAALGNGVLYISDNMASCLKKKKKANEIDNVNKNIAMLNMYNEYTEGKYEALIAGLRLKFEFRILELTKNYKEMKSDKYYALYKKMPLAKKLLMHI